MFRELVTNARTHRRFDNSRRITEDTLKELIDIARITPCGGNMQPLRYKLITSEAECAAVFPFTAWAGAMPDWSGPAESERPTAYIAICSERKSKTDSGIAGVTLQYAAAEVGLATCMLSSLKRDEIKAALDIPADMELMIMVALGLPGEQIVIDEISDGDSLKYYRSDDGIHHVPKLKLDDVIL